MIRTVINESVAGRAFEVNGSDDIANIVSNTTRFIEVDIHSFQNFFLVFKYNLRTGKEESCKSC